jgi:hypothetical protein
VPNDESPATANSDSTAMLVARVAAAMRAVPFKRLAYGEPPPDYTDLMARAAIRIVADHCADLCNLAATAAR